MVRGFAVVGKECLIEIGVAETLFAVREHGYIPHLIGAVPVVTRGEEMVRDSLIPGELHT